MKVVIPTIVGLFSLIVNLYFVLNLSYEGEFKWSMKQHWSQRAAEEAEDTVAVACSGHGNAYLDGELVHGTHVCECNDCYSGPDCSHFDPQCPAHAESGDPLFLEPFWKQHAASSAVVLSGWHRMSYTFDDHSYISRELEKQIRKVHAVANNAVTDGKYIIFGAGSTELLNAAVFAISPEDPSSPTEVVASVPCYMIYEAQTVYSRSLDFTFKGDAALWRNTTDNKASNVIEFVTSPTNPDGNLVNATLQGSSVKTIHDHAYYWPHYTPIPGPSDEDLMVFTISKFTGHAGSRFGWAVVKDEEVYKGMVEYMDLTGVGVSRDTQLRVLQLLKAILEGNGRELFDFAYKTMSKRWEEVKNIISKSRRFSIQEIAPPQYCTFFNKTRGASPAYAWLKCEREEDVDCSAVLREGNLIGQEGNKFGATDRYVRLSLIGRQDEYDLVMQRLKKVVLDEEISLAVM